MKKLILPLLTALTIGAVGCNNQNTDPTPENPLKVKSVALYDSTQTTPTATLRIEYDANARPLKVYTESTSQNYSSVDGNYTGTTTDTVSFDYSALPARINLTQGSKTTYSNGNTPRYSRHYYEAALGTPGCVSSMTFWTASNPSYKIIQTFTYNASNQLVKSSTNYSTPDVVDVTWAEGNMVKMVNGKYTDNYTYGQAPSPINLDLSWWFLTGNLAGSAGEKLLAMTGWYGVRNARLVTKDVMTHATSSVLNSTTEIVYTMGGNGCPTEMVKTATQFGHTSVQRMVISYE